MVRNKRHRGATDEQRTEEWRGTSCVRGCEQPRGVVRGFVGQREERRRYYVRAIFFLISSQKERIQLAFCSTSGTKL